jgi:pimeloyl-ACP methyl ester carboxylesterase
MRIAKVLGGAIAVLVLLVVVAVFALSDPEVPRDTLVAKYGGGASKFVTLRSGASAHYRIQGTPDGETLVLLHGSNASLHTWEPWVARLGDELRIVTIDLPGHGLTGPVPGDDYSQEGMVRFVDEATTALGIERFSLGGNSMGGGVAARFAIEHPERVERLILVDAGSMPTKTETDPGLGFTIARMPVVQNVMLVVSPRNLFAEGLTKAMADDAVVTPEMVDRYWELNRYPGSRAAMLTRFQTPRDSFVADNAARITAPTLILWGQEDTLTPVDSGEAYRDAVKGAKLVVYPSIGHIPMEETPDRSAADVRSFFRDTRR